MNLAATPPQNSRLAMDEDKIKGVLSYSSLNEFVEFLEKKGELVRIKDEVDPVLEITAIADKVSKSPHGGKALLVREAQPMEAPIHS